MGKCKCWREEHASRPFASGRCSGTKEIDLCDCGGDETKCDFYPEKRQKALEERGNLKPCPFCGGEARLYVCDGSGAHITADLDTTRLHGRDMSHCLYKCDRCGIMTKPYLTRRGVWNAWNRRVKDENA